MGRPEAPATLIERISKNILKNYKEENFTANEVLIKDLVSKNSLWASQAHQLLYTCTDVQQFERMYEILLPKIRDRHNRYKLIEHFRREMMSMLTRVHMSMGQSMNFNFWNPVGHYSLNLAVPQ